MAGRERYTSEHVIRAIHDTKGLVTLAAQRLGCDSDTVYGYIKRHPTVAAALKEERETMTDVAELSLYNCIQKGEAWAVCFYLKCQAKDRGYTERQEVEHSGRIEVSDPDSAYERIAGKLARLVTAGIVAASDSETSAVNGQRNGGSPP